MTGTVNPEKDAYGKAMAKKYPAYWRTLNPDWLAIDTYRINEMFPVNDDSGRILHARKKLLVPGVRTGGKSMRKDIAEAVATLQQWLDANPEPIGLEDLDRLVHSAPLGICLCVRAGETCTGCASWGGKS